VTDGLHLSLHNGDVCPKDATHGSENCNLLAQPDNPIKTENY